MDFRLLIVLAVYFDIRVRSQLHGVQGPVFLQEPPSTLTFSNTSGSQVSCSAHGSPTPQVDWLLQDDNMVTAVPGLRQSLGNGTLYFPPFRAQDYRKDVHSTQYRCRASNLVGTILSREVTVKAVVPQQYEVQVYRAHVLAGNTAVLTCVIPSYVRDYVTVTSWFRDDSILLPGPADMGGRYIMTSATGDLHIRSARIEDGIPKYSCLTIHSLTQERKRSEPAILSVTEATGSMPPRLVPRTLTAIKAESGSDVHLSCSAQGNPPPVFHWFREEGGVLKAITPSARLFPTQDILYIRRVEPEDSGQWSCKVSNQFGEQRLDSHLTVTAHLSVHVIPQLQVINSGDIAIFNCTVTGLPVTSVQWLRNGEPLVSSTANSSGRIKLISPMILSIGMVTRHDRGMYQCIARNDLETAQGSAELRLGDTVPELQYTFIEQTLRPGPHVSLRCSATGSPPPQFKWILDGEPLSELTAGHRYAIGQYVDQAGDVISHLNISNVRAEDGGLYSCRALNSLGSAVYSARLNIYGPPFIRSIGPVQSLAGSEMILHCPYSGFPISEVKWERLGHELHGDLRHRVEDLQLGGSLIISRLDPITDSGSYTCTVTSRNGEVARRDIQLIVHSPPILEPFSFPTSLQEGSRAQVTCSVTSGDMPIKFTWYKDSATVSASLQIEERTAEFFSMLIFKEVTSRHSGAYTCVASNNAAKANYTAQLVVKLAPKWTIEPQNVSVLLSNSIMVNCEANGFPRPQITWLRGQGKSSMDYQPLQSIQNRIVLISNGSMWIEVVAPQDEGYYLCRAVNGIGAGLSKIIYMDVNEPVRFDAVANNMSSRRGTPAVLICEVYGDRPIEMIWSHNEKRLNMNNFRFTITEMKLKNGLKSQLSIERTEREDSGVYRCQAENPFGRTEHIIHLAIQERPDAPELLEIVEIGGRSVKLSWRRAFDGNSPVLGYILQYQCLGNGFEKRESGLVNITLAASSVGSIGSSDNKRETTIVKDLLPATAYTIRMLAVNNIDQSPFTEPVIVKTQEEAPLEAPQNLQVKSVGQGELYVTWQVPPRNTWNGDLLGYIITWNEQGMSVNNTKSISVKGWATTKLQLTGLKKYTHYTVAVRAYNSISAGPLSLPVVGTTQEGVPEAAPQHVSCTQITSESMKISWFPPPKSQHGGIIQGYKVFYRSIGTENGNENGEIKRTSSSETYLHALQKFTNYSIRVLAFTNAGDGILSATLFCTTEEDVPGPPASIKASALTGESILVSWLPPIYPNGRINTYTIYAREAGRVGQHISYVVHAEETNDNAGIGLNLMFEVRNLEEHQRYEFWVSATTSIGEGEPTPIVSQTTILKTPSRIASFSQVITRPVKSNVLLPCVAVGNPKPRTLWFNRDRSITFSPFYKVTPDGHLNIHSADQSLAGNYTCSATNLFGEDKITYSLIVLLPPSQPFLELQYITSNSIRIQWKHPDDGGSSIQGYILSSKMTSDDWKSVELSPEMTSYTYENLLCGTLYYIYLVAYNRVGNGSPSNLVTINTKGGAPQVAKDKDIISTNASVLQINLLSWPDGGCPIVKFAIEYRLLGHDKWNLVSNSISEEKLFIQELTPATWYQLRITAQNDAGFVTAIYNFATSTILGVKIPFPLHFPGDVNSNQNFKYLYIAATIVCVLLVAVCAGLLWYTLQKKEDNDEDELPEQQPINEKALECENGRNCLQVYTSSPVKVRDKLDDDTSGMYEISPYATFNVAGNNSRSVTTSTLDYTVQFKTFGHLENEENNMMVYSKRGFPKSRYYNTDQRTRQQQTRMRGDRTTYLVDSESEDTNSPYNDCSGSNGVSYRTPVKSSRDIFRQDSSTESNELSPMTERRQTPRHLGGPLRHKNHRPYSSSSFEDEIDGGNRFEIKRIGLGIRSSVSSLELRAPNFSGFTNSIDLSEAECDREGSYRKLSTSSNKIELSTLLARYQQKKEDERKEFTIHV